MGIRTFSEHLVGNGYWSGENEKILNEKEHKERAHCGVQNGWELSLSLCVVGWQIIKAGRECCFIITSTATRAETRFLDQIGIRNTSHYSQRKSLIIDGLLREAG